MKFEELENKGLIRRIKINFKQIYNFLSQSKKDLQTAKFNLSIDEAWSYAIAYHAMLRAGRSLMMSLGYRPLGKDQHATVVRFASIVFGNEYKDLINKFDRKRRKRHDFIYGIGSGQKVIEISKKEPVEPYFRNFLLSLVTNPSQFFSVPTAFFACLLYPCST